MLTKIPKFRRCVIQNFPFIEEDFDALTDYELLCKVVEYLNKVITSQNEVIDTTNELSEAFEQLQSYVANFFDNLDVQDEVNIKLEEMVENGQLTELIAQFLTLNAIMSFPTVAAMKTAENLVNGSTVETYGYYAIGDKGGAKYQIRPVTNSDTIDEITLFALTNSQTLIAELIIDPSMNVRQYGAKGDGSTDDTTRIQKALDTCSNITVADGTYMVNAVTHISPNTGNRITLSNGAIIKAIATDAGTYAIIDIANKHDVEISGGTICGDRVAHTGDSGEWGHCISINTGSEKIYIHDINLVDAWGDGIYFNGCNDVKTYRVHVDNVRRNGYSLISATNFVSQSDYIENTNGTAPQAGVDLEPNTASDYLYNVVFNNLVCKNNATTNFGMSLAGTNANADYIVVNDLYCEGGNIGINLQSDENRTGKIVLNRPTVHNSATRPIGVFPSALTFEYLFNYPTVDGYYTSTNSGYAIGIQGKTTNQSGNVTFIGTTIKNVTEAEGTHSPYAMYINPSTAGYKNLRFVDPIYLNDRYISQNTNQTDFYISDRYNLFHYDSDNNKQVQDLSSLFITSSTYTTNRNLTMRSGETRFPVGTEVTFLNTGDYKMNVIFDSQYIYPLSATTGTTVTLNDKGAMLKIRKMAGTAWSVVGSTGNITTA